MDIGSPFPCGGRRSAPTRLGTTVLQIGIWAIGQRVWKWQPEGGRIGLGTSPCSGMRLRFTFGSGIGTADSGASVYGCSGCV